MLLIAAAIRLASPPRLGSAPSLHPASPASSLCPLRFFLSMRSRGVCTNTRVRPHIPPIHPPVFIHTYTPAVPNLPIHRQPILQRILESGVCMLMIARHGLYLFHLICAPSGHRSCATGVCKREFRESEKKRKRRREKENEREKASPSELCAARDEIFALSSAKYWVRVRGSARRERWKKAGERKREGLLEVEKG